MNGNKKIALTATFAAAGLAVMLTGGPASAGENVEFSTLPAAVQQTAKREVKNGKITDVEKDTEQGKVVYEIEFTLDGKSWELDIAADGKLLKRHED